MTTFADLVNEIERDFIVGYARPEYDAVNGAVLAGATSIVLTYSDALLTGAILNTGFEILNVMEYNRNSRSAAVMRGHLGTTAANIANGQIVRINPRFPDVAIFDTMLDEIQSWDERVFKVVSEPLAFGIGDTSVLATPTAQPYRVLEARKRPRFTFEPRTLVNTSVRRFEPVGQYATGYSVTIDQPFNLSTTVDVFYAVPFTTTGLTPTTDLEATVGLDPDMLEILKWGALYRLLAGREAPRLDMSVHQRADVAQAVPAGISTQVADRFRVLRTERYNEVAKRLLGRWPYRFAG